MFALKAARFGIAALIFGASVVLAGGAPASAAGTTTHGPLDCVKSDVFTGWFDCSQTITTVDVATDVEEAILDTDIDVVTVTIVTLDEDVTETVYKHFLNTRTRTQTYQTRDSLTNYLEWYDETTTTTTEQVLTTTTVTTTTDVQFCTFQQRGAGEGGGQERRDVSCATDVDVDVDVSEVASQRVDVQVEVGATQYLQTQQWLGGWKDPFVDNKGKNN